jgi:hypothetical protein
MMKKIIVLLMLSLIFFAGCSQDCDWGQHELLIERNHVIDRVNKLFIATDNRDWTRVKECFTDSVLFDMTSLAGGGPSMVSSQDIVDAWDTGLKALKAVHHQSGNFVIEINDKEADVFCYGIATHYLPNKTNQNVSTFVGSYDFHMVLHGADWKIDRFKYNLKYIDGNVDLEKSL